MLYFVFHLDLWTATGTLAQAEQTRVLQLIEQAAHFGSSPLAHQVGLMSGGAKRDAAVYSV